VDTARAHGHAGATDIAAAILGCACCLSVATMQSVLEFAPPPVLLFVFMAHLSYDEA